MAYFDCNGESYFYRKMKIKGEGEKKGKPSPVASQEEQ